MNKDFKNYRLRYDTLKMEVRSNSSPWTVNHSAMTKLAKGTYCQISAENIVIICRPEATAWSASTQGRLYLIHFHDNYLSDLNLRIGIIFFSAKMTRRWLMELLREFQRFCPRKHKAMKTLGRLLGRLLGKSSNAFYDRRLPAKSLESLLKFESDFGRFLRRLLKDSRKTLGKFLGKHSNVFYARRFPTESPGSLPKSSAQSGTNE
ncbi:hypothetical protein YC2023_078893 [Brassica napus]